MSDELRGVYKTKSIAKLTGFAPALLRAWERRHGLLEPERRPSGHRLYTEADRRVLERIRALLEQGRAIGEIAALGRTELLDPTGAGPADALAAAHGGGDGSGARPEGYVEVLVDAARSLDATRIEHLLDELFSRFPAESVVVHALAPAAYRIGEEWEKGTLSVAAEHLATSAFRRRIFTLMHQVGGDERGPVAVVACLPDEGHEMGALVTAFLTAHLGFRVVYLGAALPLEDIEQVLEHLGPEMLLLSVTRAATLKQSQRALLALVGRWAGRVHTWIGGQGTTGERPRLERAGALVWPVDRPFTRAAALQELRAPRPTIGAA